MSRIIFSLILAFTVVNQSLAQTQWPFPNSNQQGRVTGTIGEIRGSHRFHRGTDLKADDLDVVSTEKSVHAMNSGNIHVEIAYEIENGEETTTIDPYGSFIRITNTEDNNVVFYYHIAPSTEIEESIITTASVGDYLGEMYTVGIQPHLHLQTANTNYLSELSPFVDNHIPEFDNTYLQTFDGVEFYKNGIVQTTTNQANYLLNDRVQIDGEEYLTLYDKIDIAAHIKDEKTSTTGEGVGGNTSPYLITLEINNHSETEVFDQEIRYDGTPNNDNGLYCFHPDSYSGTPYRSINILTADPYESNAAQRDQFINTRLATGQTEDYSFGNARDSNLDAKINAESSFPDGIYFVDIGGCDLDQNGLTGNCMEDKRVATVIDNFKPYIESVTMLYSADDISYTVGYEGSWDWSNDQLTYLQIGGGGFLPSDFIQIEIQSSEPLSMESGYEPNISIAHVDDPVLIGNSSDYKTFIFSIPPGTFLNDGSDDGRYTLEIDAYDITQNQITGFDQLDNSVTANELPIKNTFGTWPTEALVSKTDIRHGFTLGSGCTNLPDGRVLAGDCNPLIADFSHSLDPFEPRDVQFSDLSSPDEEITGWSWDFGDGSTFSTGQNPLHNYFFYGDYVVTLTATRGSEQDSRTQIITVSGEPLQARFDVTPNTGSVPFNVQLDAGSSVGNIIDYQWSISPNIGYEYISSNENSRIATISINQSGTYDISLEVSDGTNTNVSDVTTILAGNGAAPIVDFEYTGSIYNGVPVQFFERANINCVNNIVFEWTFEGGTPATSLEKNPWVEFGEIGTNTVELCVTDGCGVQSCHEEEISIEDRNLVNNGLYAKFKVESGTQREGFVAFDVDEIVEFTDQSYTLGKPIKEWTWWFELPYPPPPNDGNAAHSGPSEFYDSDHQTVDHLYETPGKYVVRQLVWEDISFTSPNHWDEIIIIRRPASFCEEETLLTEQDINANEVLSEIAGIIKTGTGGAETDFNAKNNSDVTLKANSIRLRAGTHLQSGSHVHILPKDCDELRETF